MRLALALELFDALVELAGVLGVDTPQLRTVQALLAAVDARSRAPA